MAAGVTPLEKRPSGPGCTLGLSPRVKTLLDQDKTHAIAALQERRAFCAAVLDLHRHCREFAPPTFLQLAWDTLSARIPFDAACWLRGHTGNPAQAAAHASDGAAQMVAEYAELSSRRSLYGDRGSARTTMCLDCSESAAPADLAGFATHWKVRYVLIAHVEEPVTALSSDVVLWRRQRRQPFEDLERQLMHELALHLTDTYSLNRLAHMAQTAAGQDADAHACAIADTLGYLRVAPPRFQALLLQEFADWRGPRLPRTLAQTLAALGQTTQARYVGERIFLRFVRTGDTFLIQGRGRRALDSLTERELEVARLSAQGLGYRHIAAQLGISSATARNHLNRILLKSGASKRPRIAAELAELE